MIISERGIEILVLLGEEGEFSLAELAERFAVSPRTIRYDLDNIDYVLKLHRLNQIEKKSTGKYCLEISQDSLLDIISEGKGMTPENRILYLKLKILRENFINLSEISKKIDVSRLTLKSDFEILKREFKKENLDVESLAAKGMKLKGEEKVIRQKFSKALRELTRINYNLLSSELKEILEENIKDISPTVLKKELENLEEKYKKKIQRRDFDKILTILAANKVREKFYLEEESSDSRVPKEMEEDIRSMLLKLGVVPAVFEVEEIISILRGNINLGTLRRKVNLFLSEFQESIGINLDFTEDFIQNLIQHFRESLSENVNRKKTVERVKRDESSVFFEKFQETLEIYFPNFSIGEAEKLYGIFKENLDQELLKSKSSLVGVLVSDSTHLICTHLIEQLKTNMKITVSDIIPSYIFEVFGVEDCDLIISTENISEMINIPSYRISEKFSKDEQHRLSEYLYLNFNENLKRENKLKIG